MAVVSLVQATELLHYDGVGCANELLDDFLGDVPTDIFSVITSLHKRSLVFSFGKLLLILLDF